LGVGYSGHGMMDIWEIGFRIFDIWGNDIWRMEFGTLDASVEFGKIKFRENNH